MEDGAFQELTIVEADSLPDIPPNNVQTSSFQILQFVLSQKIC